MTINKTLSAFFVDGGINKVGGASEIRDDVALGRVPQLESQILDASAGIVLLAKVNESLVFPLRRVEDVSDADLLKKCHVGGGLLIPDKESRVDLVAIGAPCYRELRRKQSRRSDPLTRSRLDFPTNKSQLLHFGWREAEAIVAVSVVARDGEAQGLFALLFLRLFLLVEVERDSS